MGNSGAYFLGCISCIEEAVMTELFVLEPAAADEPSDRIPEGLPVEGAERGPLERALRNAGLAIASVPLDVLIGRPEADDDRRDCARRSLRWSTPPPTPSWIACAQP
jgi:hypothetical protein